MCDFFPGTILFTLFFFLQNKYDITPAATNNNISKAATMGMTAESGYTWKTLKNFETSQDIKNVQSR